jgi:osmotically inducible protein OsmC
MATRSARAEWRGPLFGDRPQDAGEGSVFLNSVGVGLPMRWTSRTSEPGGESTPEELVAAALAMDYAQCLTHKLEERGHLARELDVEATLNLDLVEPGRHSLTSGSLTVRGAADVPLALFQDLCAIAHKECFLVIALDLPISVRAVLAEPGDA